MPLTEEQQREVDKALEKEVNELDDFGVEEDSQETETTETDVEDTSGESPDEATPKDETPTDNTQSETESVSEESDETDFEDDTAAALRSEIDKLNQTILDLKSGNQPQTTEKKDETTPQKPINIPAVEETPIEYQDVDFVSGLDMDDVSADPKIFNEILNKVVIATIEHVNKTVPQNAVKNTLLAIPQVIQAQIKQQSYIDATVNEFYSANEDLVPVKYTVSQVAQSIAAEHPEYGLEQLFNEAAKKTREILKLPANGSTNKNKEFENPALAAKTSQRKKPAEVSALQKEIDEL